MTSYNAGKYGEDLAIRYLEKHGYKIIERNFRIRGGEIDIIALDGNTLVYVEVKSRTTNRFGLPQEAITQQKMRFLKRAAKFYRNNRQTLTLPDLERIDVVAINLANPPKLQLMLIKNASF